MRHLILLDAEAVTALRDPSHRKHRQVLHYAQVITNRRRKAAAVEVAVTTTVRDETGWDRGSARWATLNRLRIADIPLDAANASLAAAIRAGTGVSVADAHLGAVIRSASAERVTVVTSDPDDMRQVAGDRQITIAAI